MSTFVERWHKETSSFHLPVGEVTITLGDVASLLHLPITSAFHSFELLHVDNVVFLLIELLEVSFEKARAETIQYHGTYVQLSWLRDVYQSKYDAAQWISGSYAWEVVALVRMFENLNDASKNAAKQLAGYITLLQCWIYKHFPSVGSAIVVDDYDERKACVCRWKSGKALLVSTLTSDVVCWISYCDHRAFKEFKTYRMGSIYCHTLTEDISNKYVQTIPPHHDRWIQFSEYIAPMCQI
ncbi:Protein MAIN-LIKE 1 [Glycine max]|nr:Protein MAIN-LIKE 1 [Glycine max]